MEKIILDANVLYSNQLRGLFLWMAWRDLLEIIWSKEIWEEIFCNYSDDPEKERLFRENTENVIWSEFSHFMRKLNSGYSPLGLPDSGDEHIVALARQENVRVIVTFNMKDFPEEHMRGVEITSTHPDAFLSDFYDKDADEMKTAVREHLMSLKNTKPKKALYIQKLKVANVEKFAAKLEAADNKGELFPEVWDA